MDTLSAATAQISQETVVGQFDKLTYQCKFTQAATGTFVVEAKSQKTADVNGKDSTWYALDFGGAMSIAAETDVVMNLSELPFSHVRIRWGGQGANSGTLTVIVSAKAIGA